MTIVLSTEMIPDYCTCASAAGCGTSEAGGGAEPAAGAAAAPLG